MLVLFLKKPKVVRRATQVSVELARSCVDRRPIHHLRYGSISDPNHCRLRLKLIYQEVILEDILLMYWFHSLGQEGGFHFVLEKVSRFQISNGVWYIIPDLCTGVRNSVKSSNRGVVIWRSYILRVSFRDLSSPRKLSINIFWTLFLGNLVYHYGPIICDQRLIVRVASDPHLRQIQRFNEFVSFGANDPISSFIISGGFLSILGREETVVTVVVFL